ncbi:MAG: DNA-directed RNA polymerase subunit K [Desulfurococcaceae archaeon]
MTENIMRTYREVISERLTRFELARIIGARALQLAMGAPPLVNVDEIPFKDPVYVAIIELIKSALPMSILRWKEGGGYEVVPVSKLITPEIRKYLESILESWSISRRV